MSDIRNGALDDQSLGQLPTEQADPRFANIDRLSTAQLAHVMNEADATVPAAVAAIVPQLAEAIDRIVERMSKGGRLHYVGAGTAGRMAVIDAAECPPTFSTSPSLVNAIMAGGDGALVGAVEGAEDDFAAGEAAIEAESVGPNDTVIGIAASGRTPFVIAAVGEARRRGALTIGISCNQDTKLSAAAEHPLEVSVGPEVVAGSTRLKSATAQKLILNMISTITMVKLGRTHGNYMVDMQVLNSKLETRAVRMITEITSATAQSAHLALQGAENRIKTAIVMVEHGVDAVTADKRLDAAGGRLSKALAANN
ncbi:N-acetylmuramic acid 6-phosphate etherase [Natronoglycomyces albus]|uniref:N-acetylmuramic acid 6-phosphate etherase n=1 Tax=Natronoglycomyces albus TaxID=2811108 RepID=UPI001FE7219C|nr:N-acetylmuramic acid 6-phosphate etherase [Natronoglycomyces albus]